MPSALEVFQGNFEFSKKNEFFNLDWIFQIQLNFSEYLQFSKFWNFLSKKSKIMIFLIFEMSGWNKEIKSRIDE